MLEDEGSTKTEAAYRLLRRDILATRLAPGASLTLSRLRDAYGLGWTPLREALSRLEAEKLVTASNNRGFAVAPVSRPELEDLTRTRLVVELPLLLESMEKGGAEWEAALLLAHRRLSRCKTAVDDPSDAAVDEWFALHDGFHAALLGAASSGWLLRFQATIADQLNRHHRFLTLAPMLQATAGPTTGPTVGISGRVEAVEALRDAMSIDHHTDLMEAALDRDVERARTLMTEHIGHTLAVYGCAEDGTVPPQDR